MSEGNGGSNLDLLLRLARGMEEMEVRSLKMETTIGFMGDAVTALHNSVSALSGQVREFRLGVVGLKESFDKIGGMLREVLARTERIDDFEKRLRALEARTS